MKASFKDGLRASSAELRQIDEYRVLKRLGSGAMGSVYLAHDTLLDRPVAIKLLSTPHATPQQRARFLTEGRALARLQHPNIVMVFRVGEHEGQLYLSSQYVKGKPLSAVTTPLPSERVRSIAVGLCHGLQEAHRSSVLHRDIKPANVMLADDGELKLLDFGLAKLVACTANSGFHGELAGEGVRRAVSHELPAYEDGRGGDLSATTSLQEGQPPRGRVPVDQQAETQLHQTGVGARLGTPLYMAPEIWSGEPATVRSDIYSLGALLYEMAAGRPPHLGATLSELECSVRKSAPPALEALVPGIEPQLAKLIKSCLQTDPAARPRSADEMLRALERIAKPRATAYVPSGNPFRGLQPFEAEHQACFFGRSSERREVLDLLHSQPIVLVTGDSGVGKSSLCRAGILPALHEGDAEKKRHWQIVQLSPGRRPLLGLTSQLAPLLGLTTEEALLLGEREPVSLVRALLMKLTAAVNSSDASERGLLIFIDQMEELVTQSDVVEAAQFSELLAELATPLDRLRVLATVRGDFLLRLLESTGLRQELMRGLYVLRPLQTMDLQEAITGPARLHGIEFEDPSQVEQMAMSAARTEGGLPLLQFALAELWGLRDTERRIIPRSALERIGGVAGALARHADGVLGRMPPREQAAAEQILCGLVSLEGTRKSSQAAELTSAPDGQGAAYEAALETLVQARLVVARQAGGVGILYDLAHEALLQGWSTLSDWLSHNQERRTVLQRLDAAAAEWMRLQRASNVLWQRSQLAEADALGLSWEQIPAEAGAFLRASQKAQRKRRLRMQATWVLAVLGLVSAWLLVRWVRTRPALEALHRAEVALSLARASRDEANRLRLLAYAQFDRHENAAGEQTWELALAKRQESLSYYQQVQTESAAALAIYSSVAPQSAQLLAAVSLELPQLQRAFQTGQPLPADPLKPAMLTLRISPPGSLVTMQAADGKRSPRGWTSAQRIGQTPLDELLYSAGSYLLTIEAARRVTTRYPINLSAGERRVVSFELPKTEEVPRDFVYVPPGKFLYGSGDDEETRTEWANASPIHEVDTNGYFIAKHEVSYADWIAYLETLPGADRSRYLRLAGTPTGQHVLLERSPQGGYRLTVQPGQIAYSARQDEPFIYPQRSARQVQDWLRFPVSGINPEDLKAYTDWLRKSGRVPRARACSEVEWERAARGADERQFPHGDKLAVDDANFDKTYGQKRNSFGPDEVGAHPKSQSPFGLFDMAGNVWEIVSSAESANRWIMRGGSFYQGRRTARSNNREVLSETNPRIGMRVCADRDAL